MADPPLVSVVDDDPSVRKALRRLCACAGYRVDLFDSSESFLDVGAVDRTDCLILDVHLPGKSGLELQAELAATNKDCPIVFITAHEDEHARRQVAALADLAIDRERLVARQLVESIAELLNGNVHSVFDMPVRIFRRRSHVD